MRWLPLWGALLFTVVVTGALGDPYVAGEVAFTAIEREHFDALAVSPERGAPSAKPLQVRVNVLGDGADADLTAPFAWLRENANVIVVADPDGAPLYLTRGDLAATSGRSTLGATVPSGMAVEVSVEGVGDCVVAHEILHLLGLKHVKDRRNIMYQHCSRDFLDRATLDDAQLGQLASIERIVATTPSGVHAWAQRV